MQHDAFLNFSNIMLLVTVTDWFLSSSLISLLIMC